MADAGEIKAKVTIEYDGSGIEKAKEDLASLAGAGGTVEGSIGGANDALAQLEQQASSAADSTKALTSGVSELPKQLDGMVTGVQEVNDALGEGQAAIEDMGGSFEALQEPLGTSVQMLQDAAPPMQMIAERAASMNEQIAPVADNFAQLGDSLSQSFPMLPQFAESLHPVAEQLQAVNEQVAQTAQAFQGISFTDESGNMVSLPEGMKLAFDNAGNVIGPAATYIQDQLNGVNQSASQTSSAFNLADGSINKTSETLNSTSDNAEKTATGFTAINEAAAQTNKTLGETSFAAKDAQGSLGDMLDAAIGEPQSIGDALSSTFSGMSDFFSGGAIMQGMMAAQMLGMAVDQVGQQVYNMAAITEGPLAHSAGSFTGTMDALTQSAQVAGGQFAESYGQQIIPALNAMNYQLNQPNSIAGTGGDLGGIADTMMNLGNLEMSGVALMGGAPGLAGDLFKAGTEGFINQGAQLIGVQQPFQGPGPQQQSQISYQQQFAQLPQTVEANTKQLQLQTATYLAYASDPNYFAAQQNLPIAMQAYQEAQIKYDSQHAPETPQQALMNYQAQQYDTQQAANYQQQMANPTYSPYDPIGYWSQGQNWFNLTGPVYAPGAASGVKGFLGDVGAASQGMLGDLFGPVFGPAMQGIGGIGSWLGSLFGGGGGTNQPFQTAGGCFVAGTRVLMSDGSEKPIETLQIGEQVRAHDGTKQVQATITDRITFPAKQTYRLSFSDGTVLLTTDSHPIATTQGWKSISPASTATENPGLPVTTLEVGDSIYTADGSTCRLISLQKHEITQVYNITVDTVHVYYANNILVHNAKGFTSGGEGSENVSLSHTFTATVTWAAQNLEKSFTAAAQWAEQGLVHAATAVAQWAEQGLEHMATAVAQWAEQGLMHEATAVAQWAEQGLIHAATAVAQWAEQGLVHAATAVAQWADQGLTHLFTGVANWVGQELDHTFTGVANWVAQNLTPTFTVTPQVTMLAEGTSNWPGGPAVVGEGGSPEVVEHNGQYSLISQATLVDLPQGASVYPMKNLSSSPVAQFADGLGDGSIIPLNLGVRGQSSSTPESVNIYLQVDGQTFWSATGVSLAQNARVVSGMRSY